MKVYFIGLILLVSVGCENQMQANEVVDYGTSEKLGLGSETSDVIGYRSRKHSDIVEHLFSEAMDNDPGLEKLSESINEMSGFKRDSLEKYNEFKRYNDIYYSSLSRHLSSISDTSKRNIVSELMSRSKKNYERLVKGHEGKIDESNNLERDLKDQLAILKLVTADNLMNKYQENMPDNASIDAVKEKYVDLIEKTDKYVGHILK